MRRFRRYGAVLAGLVLAAVVIGAPVPAYAAGGVGTMVVSPTSVPAGSTTDFTLTYTAPASPFAGDVEFTYPNGFSNPSVLGATSTSCYVAAPTFGPFNAVVNVSCPASAQVLITVELTAKTRPATGTFTTSTRPQGTCCFATLATSPSVSVVPGPTASLKLKWPPLVVATQAFSMTVTAIDSYGNVTPGFTGTVHFASSDTAATLPPDTPFAPTDHGTRTFTGVVMATPGVQTITVTVLSSTIQGTGTIGVLHQPELFAFGSSVLDPDTGTVVEHLAVHLYPASKQTVTVSYATADGSATGPTGRNDYVPVTGTLTFTPGQMSKSVPVTVNSGSAYEANESFFLELSNASGAPIAAPTAIAQILNDDSPPSLAISGPASVTDSGATPTATYTVTLTGASELDTQVAYATGAVGDTAVAGTDYTSTSGTLDFPAGTTTRQFMVPITSDSIYESTKSFTVALSSPTNATSSTPSVVTTIANDDPTPVIDISPPAASVSEPAAGTASESFTLTEIGASALPASVTVATSDGTAVNGTDYTAVAPTVITFPANPSGSPQTATVTVSVLADATPSGLPETFTVGLSSPVDATVGTATATGTIDS